MNMTLEDFSNYVEKHPEIDNKLDNKIIEMAKEGNILVDSQISAYLLKDIADFKILLTCPLETRVKRMTERDHRSFEESQKETTLREKSELERFKNLYGIDINDQKKARKVYDLILDTNNKSIDEVVNLILNKLKKKK